eukprot:15229614-Alexandrium_andersonii.AAC.1
MLVAAGEEHEVHQACHLVVAAPLATHARAAAAVPLGALHRRWVLPPAELADDGPQRHVLPDILVDLVVAAAVPLLFQLVL